ncbi:TonB-dependent receptor [Sphingobium sufflavum]|uniref:TonB-dependent receptor n=1 Tax=Sphingobium sufflavum TaxID=1129547 RepID=UPI001F38FE72|nr:TonB-dependent receptor [Sphingobium sufflavum]MCE7796689.1 TonB-dependent receptor [Sphingobium sufflavum]
MNLITRLAFASVSLIALNTAASAQTQGPAQGETVETETIIVEARRRDESAQDVPLVVNAVTSEKISQLNLRDFKDIQSVVPGLAMTSNSNGIGTTSSVRGVNFDVNASGAFGTIEYYLNDTPMTSGAIFNALFDIGQIEVLRGPQGTLRGKASPSGSITIQHKKPHLYDAGGYVMGTVTDINGLNVNGAVSLPIIPGKLAIRVAGLASRDEGSRVRSINSPLSPYARSTAGRVFLRAEPTDWLNGEAVYQHIEQSARQFNQAACFNQFSAAAPACPVTIRPEDRLGIQKGAQITRSIYDIFTWKASAGFAGQRLYYAGQHTRQFINSFGIGDDANKVNGVFCGTCTTNDSKMDTHEVRLQNEELVFGLFDYVVGYFKYKANTPSYLVTGRVSGGTADAPVFAFSPTLRTSLVKEESFFGNVVLHLGERTEFSGGARHIEVNSDSRLFTVVLPAGTTAPQLTTATDLRPLITSGTPIELLFGAPNPRTFKKWIYSANAKHRFSDDFMVYANFGTSFRPGNNVVRFPQSARTSALETSFLVTPPETSNSYEIGFKSEFLRDTLKLNVAAYRQDFVNYPYRSSSGVFYLHYDSVAGNPRVAQSNFVAPVPVQVNGVEAEIDWRPSKRFNLTLNGSYALGKIKNGNVPCLDLNGDGVPDTGGAPSAAALGAVVGPTGTGQNVSVCKVNFRSSNASPWGANVQAEYSLPVSNGADAFVRGLFTYSGSSQNDAANIYDDYGSYGRLNLYAGVRAENGAWEFTLYGKNIFRNDTVLATTNGAMFTTVGTTTATSEYIGLGNPSSPGLVGPREFGLTARFAFGSR